MNRPMLAVVAVLLTGCGAAPEPIVVAGAVRYTPDGWTILDDDVHEPMHVESVTTDGDTLTVYFDFTGSQVVTFVAAPDESMAGYSVGASAGLDRAIITVTPDPAGLPDRANIWIYGVLQP